MSRRFKEEERIERIIRGLLKQPENRRCINCNSLGPQYVCTTFWTFVCTNCSGVHREFTHRVKSVSMARFNAEEVSALQAGGNERAKEIYFKAWDPQRNTLPDGSNLHRLRDFIKHVYVDRRYTGERTYGKLPMVKVGLREDTYDRQSFERSNDERSERSLRYYIDDRSPQHRPQSARAGGYKNRSARFEIVDDRFRDDAPGSGRLSRRSSNVESTAGSLSPDPRKIGEMTVSPVIRNVKDNTSENVSTPRMAECPRENGDVAGSAHALKPTSDNSQRSVETKGVERKLEKSSSLIDSSDSPQPSDKARQEQTQQTPSSTGGGNSSVQSSTIQKASSVPTMNFLETLLFELSVPPVVPSCTTSEAPSSGDAPVAVPVATSNSAGTTVAAPGTNTEAVPLNGSSAEAVPVNGGSAEAVHVNGGCAEAVPSSGGGAEEASTAENAQASLDEQHLPTSHQHQPSASAAVNDSSTVQQSNSSIEHNNQPWTSSPSQDAQVPPPNAATEQSSQGASKLSQDTGLTDGSKSSGRKELPEDLFTFSYPSYPAPVPSWQYHPSQGMGFNMQYNPAAVLMNAFPNSARSRNPFDIGDDDTSQVRAPMFPSMSSMQGALPQVHTGMQPQSSPYPSTMPPQSPSYGMSVSPGPYMGQQPPNNMPPSSRPQGGRSSFGSGTTDAFASLNPIISQTTPNSHSPSNSVTPAPPIGGGQGGNPFG